MTVQRRCHCSRAAPNRPSSQARSQGGHFTAVHGATKLDRDGELSERLRASASTAEVRKTMSVLFAFAPFLTFVLLGIHLYQVGEVIPEHDHGSHH